MKDEKDAVQVLVHTIRMNDVDDPDLMIAQPIYEWQQTDAGKWVMDKSDPAPKWVRGTAHPETYYHVYNIYGYFTPEEACFWKLKYE